MSPTGHSSERPRSWSRDGFFISTDPSLIPLDALNKAFASDALYWASALPDSELRLMLENGLSFGLYSPTPVPPPFAEKDEDSAPDPADTLHEIAGHVKPDPNSRAPQVDSQSQSSKPEPQQQQQVQDQEQQSSLIGFARLITDRVTFAWLTDVYTLPEWRGQGLGKWLISCVQEVIEDMPHLRRSACLIGHSREKGIEFYGSLVSLCLPALPSFANVLIGCGA